MNLGTKYEPNLQKLSIWSEFKVAKKRKSGIIDVLINFSAIW